MAVHVWLCTDVRSRGQRRALAALMYCSRSSRAFGCTQFEMLTVSSLFLLCVRQAYQKLVERMPGTDGVSTPEPSDVAATPASKSKKKGKGSSKRKAPPASTPRVNGPQGIYLRLYECWYA